MCTNRRNLLHRQSDFDNYHWLLVVVECKVKLLPRYMGILKHHLVNKSQTKQSTSVLFEILRSLYANRQAVWKHRICRRYAYSDNRDRS